MNKILDFWEQKGTSLQPSSNISQKIPWFISLQMQKEELSLLPNKVLERVSTSVNVHTSQLMHAFVELLSPSPRSPSRSPSALPQHSAHTTSVRACSASVRARSATLYPRKMSEKSLLSCAVRTMLYNVPEQIVKVPEQIVVYSHYSKVRDYSVCANLPKRMLL